MLNIVSSSTDILQVLNGCRKLLLNKNVLNMLIYNIMLGHKVYGLLYDGEGKKHFYKSE